MLKQLFETSLTDINSADVEGAGNVRTDAKGNRYKWVKDNNATNSTAAVHAFAVYASGDRSLVTEAGSGTLSNIAGTFMAEITGKKYGWVQMVGKGKVILFRTAANSTQTYQSIPAMAALIGVSAQDYMVTTNANRYPDEAYVAASLATLASIAGNVTNVTATVNAVLNFRL